ncbi:CHAT domain-containing protein [Streptomyces sp. Je 1-79]|uniref:CHAT domain-containing protein n=1 Tax=Streptomyces sp. Je 1-79 TaxID=2943847 RepID=UPI0021A652FD|nr:CHAT domain-containing protein [Streptomyces sp. Je 1-79]MCT4353772.1 CHAT domain-containing protein [Streptomyces sp. Je 1-79]
MSEGVPPLGDGARRLLAAVAAMDVRLPERQKIIRSLDLLASQEWSRTCVVLPEPLLAALSRAGGAFTPDELAHVVKTAGSVARMYGYDTVGVGHIAVALAATSAVTECEGVHSVQVVAEAFGLGELENFEKIVDTHLALTEQEGTTTPSEVFAWGPTALALRRRRTAVTLHLSARALAVGYLLADAPTEHTFWAWPVALAAAVSSRDRRERVEHLLGETVSPFELRLRWPWLACLAVFASAVGLHRPSLVIAALYGVLSLVSCAGELGAARQVRIEGPEIDAAGPHVRDLFSVVAVVPPRRRLFRGRIVLCASVVPLTCVWAPDSALWVPFVFLGVFTASRLSGLAVVTAAVTLLSAPSVALALAGSVTAALTGLLARAVIVWVDRHPTADVPVPRPHVAALLGRKGRALFRAHRLLRVDRPAAALGRLDAVADSGDPKVAALRGWALLERGAPGAARETVAPHRGRRSPVHELIAMRASLELADLAAAEEALKEIRSFPGRLPVQVRGQLLTTWSQLLLLREPGADLTDHFAELVPRKVSRGNLLHFMTMMRLTAEAALPRTPTLAYHLAATAVPLTMEIAGDGPDNERWFLSRARPFGRELVRCAGVVDLASLVVDGRTPDTVGRLGSGEGGPSFLMRLDRPLEAATMLNRLADHLAGSPEYQLRALDSRIEALAVLNATRHQLRTTEERMHWWSLFGRTLEQAMEQACRGRDWPTLAELIESARIQLGPQQEGGLVDVDSSGAPFIRVGGVSRLERGPWFQPDHTPPAYALEDLAAAVAGPGAWWWSTWSTESAVYWALVAPDGPVRGGQLDVRPGSDLAAVLADLRDALTVPHPGEGVEAWEDRVLGSPLLAGPFSAEVSLSRRLGRFLPSELVAVLEESTKSPLRLAIAPATRLAHVPWAAVALPDHLAGDLRMVERCRMVIAPPAGLLAALSRRTRRLEAPPLALAVVDPGSDLSDPDTDGFLPVARELLDHLPEDVVAFTPSTDLSLDGFGVRLRDLREERGETSAVIACHTVERVPSPLLGGLVLRPATPGAEGGEPERVLTAGMLIAAPDRFPMPRQVLMLCCDSGDLSGALNGEWLVLGTAVLWAGADRLVVTAYPTVDSAEGQDPLDVIDHRLVRSLTARESMLDALRTVQLEALASWRGSGTRGAPLHWAGHIAMGAFGLPVPLAPLPPAERRRVDEGVLTLLDEAARSAAAAGRDRVNRRDLLLHLGLYGFEEDLPLRRLLAVRAMTYPYAVWSELRGRARDRRADGVTVPEDVLAVLRSSADIARACGHTVVRVDHVLVAFLKERGPLPTLARRVSGWDTRTTEAMRDFLGEIRHGVEFTNRPRTACLTPGSIADAYAAMHADVPPDASDSVPAARSSGTSASEAGRAGNDVRGR